MERTKTVVGFKQRIKGFTNMLNQKDKIKNNNTYKL